MNYYGWYAVIDTLGNIAWDKICNDSLNLFYRNGIGITKTSDARYYLSGVEYKRFPSLSKTNNSFIGELDLNTKNFKWLKRYLNYDTNIEPSYGLGVEHNNAIYVTGNYNTDVGTADEIEYASLIKLDKEGNLKWKRLYKEYMQTNRIWSLTFINDGMLMLGDAKDTSHNGGYSDAWIIKTDTNGCIVPGCNAKDGMVQIINPEKVFKVYPNPAKEIVNVEVITPNTLIKNISIYNNQAQMVLSQNSISKSPAQSISVSSLANGYYTLVIELQDGSQAAKKIVIEK
jgi:hypothetical protein